MSANETTLHLSHDVLKVNNYRLNYGLQQGAFTQTEQQAIKRATQFVLSYFRRCREILQLVPALIDLNLPPKCLKR